eukprot:1842043-Rhodomonas_salina.1
MPAPGPHSKRVARCAIITPSVEIKDNKRVSGTKCTEIMVLSCLISPSNLLAVQSDLAVLQQL